MCLAASLASFKIASKRGKSYLLNHLLIRAFEHTSFSMSTPCKQTKLMVTSIGKTHMLNNCAVSKCITPGTSRVFFFASTKGGTWQSWNVFKHLVNPLLIFSALVWLVPDWSGTKQLSQSSRVGFVWRTGIKVAHLFGNITSNLPIGLFDYYLLQLITSLDWEGFRIPQKRFI